MYWASHDLYWSLDPGVSARLPVWLHRLWLVTLVWELGFPVLAVMHRTRAATLILGVIFHLGTLFTLRSRPLRAVFRRLLHRVRSVGTTSRWWWPTEQPGRRDDRLFARSPRRSGRGGRTRSTRATDRLTASNSSASCAARTRRAADRTARGRPACGADDGRRAGAESLGQFHLADPSAETPERWSARSRPAASRPQRTPVMASRTPTATPRNPAEPLRERSTPSAGKHSSGVVSIRSVGTSRRASAGSR